MRWQKPKSDLRSGRMTDYPVIDRIVADWNARTRGKTPAEQLALAYDLNETQSKGLVAAIEGMIASERDKAAEIAFREVWVRSGGIAARNVAAAIKLGVTEVTDDMMEGATRD
jgi:hypothetical protein